MDKQVINDKKRTNPPHFSKGFTPMDNRIFKSARWL